MASTTKDELRRQRLREYDTALTEARSAVAVLLQFVTGRQARPSDALLEEAFADTWSDEPDRGPALPAAVWVTMRQGDVDATLNVLIRLSSKDFVLGAHEELDAGYRLTTVEERRALPDLELLAAQLATFLHIPEDVVTVIAGWGPDDPRTAAEIDSLLEQRFGPAQPTTIPGPKISYPEPSSPLLPAAATADRVSDDTGCLPAGEGSLTLSSAEFIALLHLTPQQGAILQTLVRQTAIVISR